MRHEPLLETAISSCDHHSHRLRGQLRCCRCGSIYMIGRGWEAGRRFGPLADAHCKEPKA